MVGWCTVVQSERSKLFRAAAGARPPKGPAGLRPRVRQFPPSPPPGCLCLCCWRSFDGTPKDASWRHCLCLVWIATKSAFSAPRQPVAERVAAFNRLHIRTVQRPLRDGADAGERGSFVTLPKQWSHLKLHHLSQTMAWFAPSELRSSEVYNIA
eukprot:1195794-Prorocentrum_minimum.AAC.1